MIANIVNTLINGIFNIITSLLDIILIPINSLITNLFPSFNTYLATFNSMCSQYIIPFISYFFSMLPPLTKGAIIMWYTFVIAYYTISWTYALAIKTFNVIQKIKLW